MKKPLISFVLTVVIVAGVTVTNYQAIQIKKKFGMGCEVVHTCDEMFYVDCGAAVDGPAYYLGKDLEVIGTSGGLCMQECTGAPEKWKICDGRQSDGPSTANDVP